MYDQRERCSRVFVPSARINLSNVKSQSNRSTIPFPQVLTLGVQDSRRPLSNMENLSAKILGDWENHSAGNTTLKRGPI
jgi:hypothetical protein